MATTKQQPMTREGQGGGNRLIFPNHLAELINQDIGHPFLMLLLHKLSFTLFFY